MGQRSDGRGVGAGFELEDARSGAVSVIAGQYCFGEAFDVGRQGLNSTDEVGVNSISGLAMMGIPPMSRR